MSDQSTLLADVRSYLSRRRNDYIDFFNAVSLDLARFHDHSNNRSIIYRIYSRKDKQAGSDPLKADWKIARRLGQLRALRGGRAGVYEIHDIIGVTIVAYFSSQIDLIVDRLMQPVSEGGLGAQDPNKRNERGYHAVHLKLTRREGKYYRLQCEVQVKTLLHDGWATKTHDLTYKPQGETSPDLVRQMEIIGEGLQLTEKHSDILRQLIERDWYRDRQHRERAQQELLTAVASENSTLLDQAVLEASKSITSDRVQLSVCSESDSLVQKHFDAWNVLVEQFGYCKQTCRLITLLASTRESRDLDGVAFDAIESWISSAVSAKTRLPALQFYALAAYGLNDIERALEQQRGVYKFVVENSLPAAAVSMNLAYYLAEGQFRTIHQDVAAARSEARNLVGSIDVSALNARRLASFLDTQGAVEIAFGENEAVVRAGLEVCRRAVEKIAETDPQKLRMLKFFRLHEARAWHRISTEWN